MKESVFDVMEQKELNKKKDRRFIFGRYNGKLVRTIIRKDPQYIDYCMRENHYVDIIKLVADNYGLSRIKFPYGKNKNKSVAFVYITERGYVQWCQKEGVAIGIIELVKPELLKIKRELFGG